MSNERLNQIINMPYGEFVNGLIKPGTDIVAQMTPEKAHLWHMATGVAGEGGELLDAFKKHCVYNKPLDRENVIEELGDLEFFMQAIRDQLGVTREETLFDNKMKLSKRYQQLHYTDAEAHDRADKAN